MTSSMHLSNEVGAATAVLINLLLVALFIARLGHGRKIEYWLGFVLISTLLPLFYLLIMGARLKRPFLYFIQIGLMMAFLVVELLVDYVFKIEFRQVGRLVIPYITLFYAAAGGMIGVAGQAGTAWTIAAVISFLVMAILSLAQHFITGQ